MAAHRAQSRAPLGVVGQTVTIPVSLRVESYPASNPSPSSPHEDELREMRVALQGVREELRQVKLTVAELVRISYESVARLDSLMAPARLGAHIMEAMQRAPAQSDGLQRGGCGDVAPETPQTRDTSSARRPPAVTAPQRSAGGGSAARGKQQQRSFVSTRPAAVKTQKKKPVPSTELLSELSAKQDSDPVVSLVKTAVSGGQELSRQERESWPKESQLLMRQWSRLELRDGVLYRRACLKPSSPPVLQLVTSSESVRKHIQAAHKRLGHCGAERLLDWARGQLFSPGLATQVEQLIRQCEKCGAAQRDRSAAGEGSLRSPDPARETSKGHPARETAGGHTANLTSEGHPARETAMGHARETSESHPARETAGGHTEKKTAGGHPARETPVGHSAREGSPEVYSLAPDQDPEQDPDTILLPPHRDSTGTGPREQHQESGPLKKVPASCSPDVVQQPLCQRGLQNHLPPAAAAEPLAGNQPANAEPSGAAVDPSPVKTDCDSQPIRTFSQQESPGCAGKEAAIEA